MKRAEYNGDPRYWLVWEKMQLLGIKDVSSAIQEKNGTIIWRLPIRNNNSGKTFIEVGSFSTGYERNQNSGYSNYQLNKRCESEPQYYSVYEWCDESNMNVKTDKFRQYTTRACELIPVEIDRLEYLLSYCVKNYFIKRANEVADGKYVSQWYHDWSLERQPNTANHQFETNALQNKLANSVPKWKHNEAMARVNDLEEKLEAMTEDRDCKSDRIYELESQVDVADNKLSNAISPTKYESVKRELAEIKVRQDISVIVNGHRYKVL